MGMMGMFKWLRKDVVQRDRNGWNLTQKQCGLNNESYRNALQAFIDRRRISDDADVETPSSPDKKRADLLAKNNNVKDSERKSFGSKSVIPGVPHVLPSEIFEIGWVAGTEDRYIELIFAEWQNTRVSLKRHSHPDCKYAVKADLDVLSEIRHPNVLLLMATTYTDDHGLVSLFESVDCTLYHYIHDQGERISIQGIAKCGGRLSDALRHAHMRGYVHTAISSHCVYLASNGIVKLGGWELAMDINSPRPDREYEERLRTEIFRWQAPELFQGYEPRKESDVYGLTLLIWEMCTMHIPWSGYSKADVERQYAHWKRGVIMDLYDFPPLLNNLLEAGLQLDINKRTLDMNRMRRFLQRLEMQYEDEDLVYIDQYVNNNNETGKTYVIPMGRSPMGMKGKGAKLIKSASAKQLSYAAKSPDSPPRQYLYAKKTTPKQGGNLKTTAHVEQINVFADDAKRNAKDDIEKNTNVLASVQNNYKRINYTLNSNVETSDTVRNERSAKDEHLQPWNSTYRKVKAPLELLDSRTASVYSSPLLESTDDESYKDARTNLKQLKKVLANRREHFFYGSDSSHASAETSPNSRNKIFIQAKSKHYEPHKPASHKTSLEPKCSKSPNQYDPTYMKSSHQQYRKIPYLHIEGGKDGLMQRQALTSDPQNVFETSLWRKEKLICLSKMRKTCVDETQCCVTAQTDDNDTVSTETLSKNGTVESFTIRSDGTYVIKRRSEGLATETESSQDGCTRITEVTSDSTEPISPPSKPLKVLKDALDRATKIVRSVTPNTDDSFPSPPFKTYQDFEITEDNGQTCKSLFESLYDLQLTDGEEIKTIEKSTTKGDTFLFDNDDGGMKGNEKSITERDISSFDKNAEETETIEKSATVNDTFLFDKDTWEQSNNTSRVSTSRENLFLFDQDILDSTVTSKQMGKESENDITVSVTSLERMSHSYDTTYSRNFVCESIAEVSSEFNSSYNETKSDERIRSVNDQTIDSKPRDDTATIMQDAKSTAERGSIEGQVRVKEEEKSPFMTNFNLMLLNDTAKNKNCKACHQSALPRRRSLPAALSQLRGINSSALGKLPIRRGDVPDSTVEDLYIDDEFGDSLNVNMVLLDEDLTDDEDFLPEMLELYDSREQ